MKICSNCGAKNDAHAWTCVQCGKQVADDSMVSVEAPRNRRTAIIWAVMGVLLAAVFAFTLVPNGGSAGTSRQQIKAGHVQGAGAPTMYYFSTST